MHNPNSSTDDKELHRIVPYQNSYLKQFNTVENNGKITYWLPCKGYANIKSASWSSDNYLKIHKTLFTLKILSRNSYCCLEKTQSSPKLVFSHWFETLTRNIKCEKVSQLLFLSRFHIRISNKKFSDQSRLRQTTETEKIWNHRIDLNQLSPGGPLIPDCFFNPYWQITETKSENREITHRDLRKQNPGKNTEYLVIIYFFEILGMSPSVFYGNKI